MRRVKITGDRATSLKNESEKFHYESSLFFLRNHNGLRPKKIHLVTGTPSGGKSTLRNTIILDFLESNPGEKVFIWLSEESYEDFETDISRNPRLLLMQDRIITYSEQDEPASGEFLDMKSHFRESVYKSECDLFIFDNITTSRMYDNYKHQQKFASWLKVTIRRHGCSSVILAHTSTGSKEDQDSFIDRNDIRGSRDIVNLAEFQYVMQTFKTKDIQHRMIKIVKHRGTEIKGDMFYLDFDNVTRCYKQTVPMSFDDLKKILDKRVSLFKKR